MKSLRHVVSFQNISDSWYHISRYLMIRNLHNISRNLDESQIHSNLYAYVHHSYSKIEIRYWFWMDKTSLSFRPIHFIREEKMNRKIFWWQWISQKISHYIPLHITEENRNCRLTRRKHQYICVNRWGSNLLKLTHKSN